MSTSRLEKFIYAICSMEVTDLPVPLSRIEILWNCLITGETPDFEPLYRNEKYLMAMLGLYELDQLPTPLSRGEKLLYKIAVGETDLSDVPGYLSRYEELLKYLIENGGIGFEYVLYTLNQSLSTLYQTVEKPVKSAILKGQTLVNLVTTDTSIGYTLTQDGEYIKKKTLELIDGFDAKTYTFICELSDVNIVNPSGTWVVYISTLSLSDNTADNTSIKSYIKNGKVVFTYTPSRKTKTINNFSICLHTDSGVGSSITISNVVVLDGDYTNVDIPYFEGMQSVKLPVLKSVGKNLFDLSKMDGISDNVQLIPNGIRVVHFQTDITHCFPVKFKENTQYTFSFNHKQIDTTNANREGFRFYYTDGTNSFAIPPLNSSAVITSDANKTIKSISLTHNNYGESELTYIQLEEGSKATPYEPHKSNILTVNEPIELRGIGDAQDTLDCLTGEVTERIGEVVLDGSEDEVWYKWIDDPDSLVWTLPKSFANLINPICDRYVIEGTAYGETKEMLAVNNDVLLHIQLRLFKTTARSIEDLKTYLQANPITIQYQLATESTKTVDLTTVDQDGQPTKLKTFNDITYVEINADSIIPSVNVEVATKINETLSTLGLEHHDISNTQNQLGQTIDEQTENTDAAMLATTEIYENL